MMNSKSKLTLARQAAYQITVSGELNARWPNLYGDMTLVNEFDDSGRPRTTLAVSLDQAGLQGLLRRLYSLGFPLISIQCVDCG